MPGNGGIVSVLMIVLGTEGRIYWVPSSVPRGTEGNEMIMNYCWLFLVVMKVVEESRDGPSCNANRMI